MMYYKNAKATGYFTGYEKRISNKERVVAMKKGVSIFAAAPQSTSHTTRLKL